MSLVGVYTTFGRHQPKAYGTTYPNLFFHRYAEQTHGGDTGVLWVDLHTRVSCLFGSYIQHGNNIISWGFAVVLEVKSSKYGAPYIVSHY